MSQALDTSPEALARIEQQARAVVAELAPNEQVALLRDCRAAWADEYVTTFWTGGVYDTVDGTTCRIRQEELVGELIRLAQLIQKKGTGPWFTLARTNGGAHDADVDYITGVVLDADEAGDWHTGNPKLIEAGLAFIAKRSSRHTLELPKFHLLLPFGSYFSGEKPEWRQVYRHLLGVFSELYGFGVASFDRAPDRMAQPVFPATRQSVEAVAAEVLSFPGDALNVELLLERTGFELQYSGKPERKPRARRQKKVASVATDAVGLVGRAFQHAGMAAGATTSGALRVRCPWDDDHTTGEPFDGSSVVFPPRVPGERGVFHCSHDHCLERSRDWRLVLAALPPAALTRALIEEGRRG